MFKRPDLKKKALLYLGDVVLITCALYLSVWIRTLHFVNIVDRYTGATVFNIVFYGLSFYTFGLYDLSQPFRSTAFLTRFLVALFLGTALISSACYMLPNWRSATRGIFLMNMIFSGGFVFLWRLAFQDYFSLRYKSVRIVIVGAGYSGKTILETLKNHTGFEVLGFVDDDVEKHNKKIGAALVLGGSRVLLTLAQDKQIDAVVVAITHEKKAELLHTLLEVKLKGVEIYDMPTMYESVTGKIPVAHLRDGWVVYAPFSGLVNNMYHKIKRYLDAVAATLGLIIGFPVMLVVAVLIKFDSRGPALFKQKRVGLDEKIYVLRKFRSMVRNAEQNGAVWAKEHDSRVTRLGKFLRKSRLDELPQLWNILVGDMSFIGPRPERPEFVMDLKKEIPFYSLRHTIKPGLTGWAQVNFKYGASKEDAMDKMLYDLYYLKNLSLLLDLQIFLKTINVVMCLDELMDNRAVVEEPNKKIDILIADDEEIVQEVLGKFLDGWGYNTFLASNGSEALNIVNTNEVRLAFIDIRMPGFIDGLGTLKRIKKINKNIEVIIMTGYGTENARRESRDLGAYAYLEKPFDLSDIRSKVDSALSKQECLI